MRLYQYLDRRGRPVISEWIETLQVKEQAALEPKLDAVRSAGEHGDPRRGELPPNLFRGPVKHKGKSYPNTYKLTAGKGSKSRALRPLACRGPFDTANEWTLLCPAIEVGGKYPDGVFAEAERRRMEIIRDPSRRVEMKGIDDE